MVSLLLLLLTGCGPEATDSYSTVTPGFVMPCDDTITEIGLDDDPGVGFTGRQMVETSIANPTALATYDDGGTTNVALSAVPEGTVTFHAVTANFDTTDCPADWLQVPLTAVTFSSDDGAFAETGADSAHASGDRIDQVLVSAGFDGYPIGGSYVFPEVTDPDDWDRLGVHVYTLAGPGTLSQGSMARSGLREDTDEQFAVDVLTW